MPQPKRRQRRPPPQNGKLLITTENSQLVIRDPQTWEAQATMQLNTPLHHGYFINDSIFIGVSGEESPESLAVLDATSRQFLAQVEGVGLIDVDAGVLAALVVKHAAGALPTASVHVWDFRKIGSPPSHRVFPVDFAYEQVSHLKVSVSAGQLAFGDAPHRGAAEKTKLLVDVTSWRTLPVKSSRVGLDEYQSVKQLQSRFRSLVAPGYKFLPTTHLNTGPVFFPPAVLSTDSSTASFLEGKPGPDEEEAWSDVRAVIVNARDGTVIRRVKVASQARFADVHLDPSGAWLYACTGGKINLISRDTDAMFEVEGSCAGLTFRDDGSLAIMANGSVVNPTTGAKAASAANAADPQSLKRCLFGYVLASREVCELRPEEPKARY